MAKDRKQQQQPNMSIERRDILRSTAKPGTEILFDVDADKQQIFIVGRGRLDLSETVVVISIADAANLAAAFVQFGATALCPAVVTPADAH